MRTRTRALASTLLLVAVAAGAVLYAWFGIARKDESERARKTSEAKLYSFSPADVVSVTVEAKRDVTRLVRAGAGWRVEAPVSAEAERAAVDALVDRIAGLTRSSAVADHGDAQSFGRYGLAKPRAVVTLTLKDGASQSLALGDENAFDGTAFVRTTSGAIALVPGDIKWAVERSTFELREKRLLPFEEDELERVEVSTPDLRYALVPDGSKGWRLDAPVKERADDGVAGRLLGAIRGLRATAFEPAGAGDGAARGASRWRVTLVSKRGSRRTLDIFGATSGAAPANAARNAAAALHAQVEGSPETALVAPEATRDLDQDLFALRDKALLRFERESVTSLRFDRDGSRFEVRRESAPARLAEYLWTLSSLHAKAFADETGTKLAQYGLDRPAMQVTLVGADAKEIGRLLVSAPRDGRTFAKSAASNRISEIDPAALADLPRSAADATEPASSGPQAKAGTK